MNHVIWTVAMVVDQNFSNVASPKLNCVAEEGDGVVYRATGLSVFSCGALNTPSENVTFGNEAAGLYLCTYSVWPK